MKYIFGPFLLTAVLATTVIAAPLVINTPTLVEAGHPTIITWSGGEAPFFFVNNARHAGDIIADLGEQQGDEATWVADVAPGTVVDFAIRDSTGALAESADVVVSV